MDPLVRIESVPLRIDPTPPLRLVRRDDDRPHERDRRHSDEPEEEPEDDAPEDDGKQHIDVLA